MKTTVVLLIVLGAIAMPTYAQKVTIDYAHDFDFEAGERHLLRAIALDPSSAHFHCWLSTPLAARGRIDDCVAHVEKALQLEPMSAIIQTLAGINMQFGDPERGLHHMRNGFEMQPENPITGCYLGFGLGEFRGRLEEASVLQRRTTLGLETSKRRRGMRRRSTRSRRRDMCRHSFGH